jgi:hypothetical protein
VSFEAPSGDRLLSGVLLVAMAKPKKKQPSRPRSFIALVMILQFSGKGGPMHDRRLRRPKDAKHSWKKDQDA